MHYILGGMGGRSGNPIGEIRLFGLANFSVGYILTYAAFLIALPLHRASLVNSLCAVILFFIRKKKPAVKTSHISETKRVVTAATSSSKRKEVWNPNTARAEKQLDRFLTKESQPMPPPCLKA
ncbi:photosystem I P700 chlorophyll a apoprotein A2 [Striga asiatica]|uniref:Photosystem I P700 chlorophyll a apoprotein A2 n=1 Tax=Striga asiatica TaxID=4170 RepID=A0A5A7Q2M8_STRAF|nr:photosystem I P700 chlorophyll a apoprotein A2 [Striga asiatica]